MLYRNTAGLIDASMVVVATGAALESGTVYCYVKRKSDGFWLKADTSWTTDTNKPTGGDIPTMTHVSGGLWSLEHTPADIDDEYQINCIDSGVTCYPDNYVMSVSVSAMAILQIHEGNQRKTFVQASAINSTRKVGVGRIDYIKIETKADDAADWSSPTSTKYLYMWYAATGDINPIMVGENN
jgi:hypothetical protein